MRQNSTFDFSVELDNNEKQRIRHLSGTWDQQRVTISLGEYNILIHPSEIKFCSTVFHKDYADFLNIILKEFGSSYKEAFSNLFMVYGDEFGDNTDIEKISLISGLTVKNVMAYLYEVQLGNLKPKKNYCEMIKYMMCED